MKEGTAPLMVTNYAAFSVSMVALRCSFLFCASRPKRNNTLQRFGDVAVFPTSFVAVRWSYLSLPVQVGTEGRALSTLCNSAGWSFVLGWGGHSIFASCRNLLASFDDGCKSPPNASTFLRQRTTRGLLHVHILFLALCE